MVVPVFSGENRLTLSKKKNNSGALRRVFNIRDLEIPLESSMSSEKEEKKKQIILTIGVFDVFLFVFPNQICRHEKDKTSR